MTKNGLLYVSPFLRSPFLEPPLPYIHKSFIDQPLSSFLLYRLSPHSSGPAIEQKADRAFGRFGRPRALACAHYPPHPGNLVIANLSFARPRPRPRVCVDPVRSSPIAFTPGQDPFTTGFLHPLLVPRRLRDAVSETDPLTACSSPNGLRRAVGLWS